MKTLHGFENPVVNNDIGSIDYMDQDENKMLRVILEGDKQTRYAHMVKQTVDEAETTDVNEVIIISNKLTNTARKLVKSTESVSIISPKIWQPFSITELKYVLEKKINYLQDQVKDDPNLLEQIETVKRNAKFHASMKWNDLLMEDLSTLVSIENEIESMAAH
jgi:hypothetical protein